jgi:hypothetical protein
MYAGKKVEFCGAKCHVGRQCMNIEGASQNLKDKDRNELKSKFKKVRTLMYLLARVFNENREDFYGRIATFVKLKFPQSPFQNKIELMEILSASGKFQGLCSFVSFLDFDLMLVIQPFIAWMQGDGLPMYQSLPLYAYLYNYYNKRNIVQCVLILLHKAIHLKKNRPDILLAIAASTTWLNEEYIELQNSRMSKFGAKRGGSSEDRAQLHSILLAVNAKLVQDTKIFVGMDREDSASEMEYLMKIWTSDTKKFEKTNESLRTYLFEELTRHLEGTADILPDTFLQLPMVYTGKEHFDRVDQIKHTGSSIQRSVEKFLKNPPPSNQS